MEPGIEERGLVRKAVGSIWGVFVATWRWLKRMRVAITLLLVLTGVSIIGTLIPQAGQNPRGVFGFEERYGALATVFRYLGFFDIYGVWWFQLLVLTLFASLLSCVLPRVKRYYLHLRAPKEPITTGFMERLVNRATLSPRLPADEALGRAEAILRKRRFRLWRVSGSEGQVYAEKNRFHEFGSILFHISFILLLVGIVYGKLNGFDGTVSIIEGDTWVEGHANYDIIREGVLFDEQHQGFRVRVDDYKVTYYESGAPSNFETTLSVFDNGKKVASDTIFVNGKLIYKGVKFYQSSYGWAPRVKVTRGDEVLADGPVVFLGQPIFSQGVVKVPAAGPPPAQVGLEFFFVPDPVVSQGQVFGNSPLLNDPTLYFRLYQGDLGLNVPQSVYSLDKTGLAFVSEHEVKLNGTTDLPGGLQVSFPEIREWTGLQVAKDPGIPTIYTAFTLALIGVLISFYLPNRRVWVLVVPDGATSQLWLGGLSRHHNAFSDEFKNLTEEVKDSLKKKKTKARN